MKRRTPKRSRLKLTALFAVLLLVGCGDGTPGNKPEASAVLRKVTVVSKDGATIREFVIQGKLEPMRLDWAGGVQWRAWDADGNQIDFKSSGEQSVFVEIVK